MEFRVEGLEWCILAFYFLAIKGSRAILLVAGFGVYCLARMKDSKTVLLTTMQASTFDLP